MSTVPHRLSTAQHHAIASLTGHDAADTLRWQPARMPTALQAQTAARATGQRLQGTMPWRHSIARGPDWCRHPHLDGRACPRVGGHPLPARHP